MVCVFNIYKLSNYCFCSLGCKTVNLLLNIRCTLIQNIYIKKSFYNILVFFILITCFHIEITLYVIAIHTLSLPYLL